MEISYEEKLKGKFWQMWWNASANSSSLHSECKPVLHCFSLSDFIKTQSSESYCIRLDKNTFSELAGFLNNKMLKLGKEGSGGTSHWWFHAVRSLASICDSLLHSL